MTRQRPLLVTCNDAKSSNGKRQCGATALYEGDNPAAGHAYYRCQKPECKSLMIVCFNKEHVQ